MNGPETRIVLIGHGRMGLLVAEHAAAHHCVVTAIVGRGGSIADAAADADVAIDFSVGDAVPGNVAAAAEAGLNIVIGATGWGDRAADVRAAADHAGIGVLAAANFALGLHIHRRAVETAARHFARHPAYGAWIHEAHHAQKKDAPSGTALLLEASARAAGFAAPIGISSTRAGSIPGTHTVGFDGPSDTVTLTHTVRDRAVFAHGALEAARWLAGRRGWFSIDDFLSSVEDQ